MNFPLQDVSLVDHMALTICIPVSRKAAETTFPEQQVHAGIEANYLARTQSEDLDGRGRRWHCLVGRTTRLMDGEGESK